MTICVLTSEVLMCYLMCSGSILRGVYLWKFCGALRNKLCLK
jgi:hypothetical protein